MIADRDARLNRCEKTIGFSKLKVEMKSSNRLNFKLQIQGSHLTILAYEAWLGTGPSAMTLCCRHKIAATTKRCSKSCGFRGRT